MVRSVIDFIPKSLGIAERMMRNAENGGVKDNGMSQGSQGSQGSMASIVMYTTQWCGDCWRAKQVMDSMKVRYTEVDISHDEDATELVMRLNRGHRSVPTLVFPDGSVMTEPRTNALVEKLRGMV